MGRQKSEVLMLSIALFGLVLLWTLDDSRTQDRIRKLQRRVRRLEAAMAEEEELG